MALKVSPDAAWVPVLRYVQIVLSFLLFILGIVCVAKISFSDPAVAIVAGIFGLIYYIALVVPVAVSFISPAVSLGAEIWLTIWWIVSLGVTANDFGGVPCSGYYFYFGNWTTGCQIGKALIAFSVIGFVLSLITLGLVSAYGVHPLISTGQNKAMLARNAFPVGGVFLAPGFGAAPPADLEKGPEAEDAGVDALAAPAVPVDNATYHTQSTEGAKEPEHFEEPVAAERVQ